MPGYANASRPMGFIPLDSGGRANTIQRRRPFAAVRNASAGGNASTDMAVGDAYSLDGNGNAYRSGPNDTVRGIVLAFEFQAVSTIMSGQGPVSVDYVTGTQTGFILGCEDPSALFVVQADTFALGNVGGKFNLADAAPATVLAQSRQTLNVGAGAGAQFQAADIQASDADNTYGANARVEVRMLQTFNN